MNRYYIRIYADKHMAEGVEETLRQLSSITDSEVDYNFLMITRFVANIDEDDLLMLKLRYSDDSVGIITTKIDSTDSTQVW